MKIQQKIILIAPIYFNYHQMIINALEANGHQVDFIPDKNSGLLYSIANKSSLLLRKYQNIYKNEIIKRLTAVSYDRMIVIGGKTLKPDFWQSVRENHSFKMVLYQWDSIQVFDYSSMIKSFDIVKTFDSVDAKNLNIPYLPLFYKNQNSKGEVLDIDLLFVGIWHSDRIDVLNQIIKFAKQYGLKYFIKVYYPKYLYLYLVYIKKHFKKSDLFIFKPISSSEMKNLYQNAKCVIDINHPWQSGLTMRTIETIGSGKKLITTNDNIKNEVFFNSDMIEIINRNNVQINREFFSNLSQYQNIEKFEINNWVLELI